MFENIRLAFQGIWSHKMRSFLTMLGIIIGIAAIIAIGSTITGTNEKIKSQLVGSGKNTVDVQLYEGGYPYTIYDSSSIPQGIPVVSESTMKSIGDLSEVESATSYCSRYLSDNIYYGTVSISDVYMYGVDDTYFDTCGYVTQTGRGFVEKDYTDFRKVLILDETAGRTLFNEENPLGKVIEIKGVPFTVVGVVTEALRFQPNIESVEDYYINYQNGKNGLLFIPKASWPIIFNYDEPENVVVRATSTDDMTRAGKKTADILNKTITNQESEVKYAAADLQGQVQELQELRNTTNMQLVWIAGISLLVGGIGVMNIMLVSVTERTSEIGLKKALGARKGVILGQFLTEAAVLTSLGGLLGVASGIGAAQVLHRILGFDVGISIPAAVVAVVFSMVIGIVFGFLPSVKAANLDPIEALRRE